MDINKGLNTDIDPINLPSGSWIQAKNIIRQQGKGIKTHKGFSEIGSPSGVNIGYIEVKDITILFTLYNSTTFIISKFQNNTTTVICKTTDISYLNILSTTRFTGTYTYNYKGELLISFFDWVNKGRPMLLNIEDLPFPLSGTDISYNTDSTLERTLELMFLQPKFNTPFINVESTTKGGNLKCGVYQFCIAYEINDFDFTSPSLISEPVPMGNFGEKGTETTNWTPKVHPEANITNHITVIADQSLISQYGGFVSKSINLKIHNLDRTFSRFKLIVLFRTGESNEAYTAGIYNITSDSIEITITGDELYSESYESIVLGRARFKGLGAISKFQNKLSILDVEYEDDEVWMDANKTITYQTLANNIKIQVHIESVDADDYSTTINTREDGTPTTFKADEGDKILKYSTFQPDEVYALYIAFGKGDKISKGYHIQGRIVETISGDWINITPSASGNFTILETDNVKNPFFPNYDITTPNINIDSNEKLLDNNYVGWYQIRDTSDLATLKLGYWENQDEYYEDGITKVRHHKMPSLKSIQDYVGGEHLNYRIGLNFDYSSIVIPDSVSAEYDTIYLLYADRTYNESTVLGMSPILSNRTLYSEKVFDLNQVTTTSIYSRFYDFGLNAIKPNISPTHIQSEFVLQHDGREKLTVGHYSADEIWLVNLDIPYNMLQWAQEEDTKIKEISAYFYVEEGDTNVLPKNILEYEVSTALTIKNRESALCLISLTDKDSFVEELEKDIFGAGSAVIHSNHSHVYPEDLLILNYDGERDRLLLGTLKSFKSSVYVNYKNKNLIVANCINTGTSAYKPNGVLISSITTSDLSPLRFLGDCVINNEFFRTKVNYFTDDSDTYNEGSFVVTSVGWTFPNYTRVNSNFRIDTKGINDNETYSYNIIFSTKNGINLFQPSNTEFTSINRIRTRFTRSIVLGTEAKEIGWRVFSPLDYYDFPTNAGAGTYLNGGDLSLMFGFEKDVYVAEIKETLETGTGNTLALKTNSLFDISPIRITEVFQRSVNIASLEHIFITKYGFVFLDGINKSIYLFDGKNIPIPISKFGIDNYIKQLPSYTSLVGAYDEETDHIFFTINNTDSWSFYLTEKQIVSKYDYKLKSYLINNGIVYGFTNDYIWQGKFASSLMQFNSSLSFANYYAAGTSINQRPAFIDIVFTDNVELSKLIESVIWNETTIVDQVTTYDKHLTDIVVYTDFQCSVVRPFVDYIKYINGNYHLNNIKDSKRSSIYYIPNEVLDYSKLANVPCPAGNIPVLPNEVYYLESGTASYNGVPYTAPCKIRVTLNSVIINHAGSVLYFLRNWFDKSNIISKFAVIRFILNDSTEPNKEVKLNSVLVNYSKSI